MQYRRVGQSGLVVSAIGFGCNNLGRPQSATEEPKEAIRVVNAAVDAGITYFDTADIYGKTPAFLNSTDRRWLPDESTLSSARNLGWT